MTPSLVYAPHPLLAAAGRRMEWTPFEPGESIEGYLERVGVRADPDGAVLALNDTVIDPAQWGQICPRAGDLITVRARAADGGGNGGSDPLRTALTIAVMVGANYLAPGATAALGLEGATFFGVSAQTIVGGAISLAGNFLINALLPPPRPTLPALSGRTGAEATSPTYAIAGGSNRARLFQPMLLVCGRHRVFPDLGAREFTEFVDDEQFYAAVFHCGLGDVLVSELKIGDTPIGEFAGVEVEISGADGRLALFPGNVDTIAGGTLSAATGWIQRTSSLRATALAVEISGSLYYAGDSGIEGRSAAIEIEYREAGAGTWLPFAHGTTTLYHTHYWSAGRYESYVPDEGALTTIWVQVDHGGTDAGEHTGGDAYDASNEWRYRPFAEVNGGVPGSQPRESAPAEAYTAQVTAVTITSDSQKPVRRTFRIGVAEGQYEVRVRRTTADETDARAVSQLTWSQLRTYQPNDADYTSQRRIGLRMRATGQLQGRLDSFNLVASGRTEAWDAVSAWATIETSNPAWWFLAVARGRSLDGRRVYGAGYADSRIDVEGLKAWGAFCTAKGLTFNAVFDAAMSVGEALTLIARCGRATVSHASGKLGVVWEAQGAPVVQVFGMGNIRASTLTCDYVTERLADEVVLEFINPDTGWQTDRVRASAAGVATPQATVTVSLFGCTDAAMAGREANMLVANNRYHRNRFRWEADLEGLVAARGDVAILAHDLMRTRWGYSGRLVSGTTTALVLDRAVPFTPGTQHWLGVRLPDGSFGTYRVQYTAGSTASITLTDALPQSPNADPHGHAPLDYLWFFDLKQTPGRKVRIVDVVPRSMNHVAITAVDESDEYFAAEAGIYTHATPPSAGAGLPVLTTVEVAEQLVPVGNGFAVNLILTWDVTGPYSHAVILAGVGEDTLRERGVTFGRRFELLVPDTGSVRLEIVARDAGGRFGAGGRDTRTYAIVGKARPPASVPWFRIDGAVLSWGQVTDADLAGYRLRFHYGDRRTWADAADLVDGVVTESPFELTRLPPGAVTLLIKAVDTSGNESANAAAIVTMLGDALVGNVVETIDFAAEGFSGTITGGTVALGVLNADVTTPFYGPDDAAPFYTTDGAPLYPATTYAALAYETRTFTPAAALAGSRLTLDATVSGDPVAIEFRQTGPQPMYSTLDTDPFYSADADALYDAPPAFETWAGAISVRNEPYQFRVTAGQGGTRGVVSDFAAVIDAPDLEERLDDVVIGSGGTRLPITADFTVIKNLQLTLQADGGTAIAARGEDKDAAAGPLVRCFDAGGSAVAGLVDAVVQGY